MCSARFSLPLLLSPSVALRAPYPIAGLQLHNMSLLQPFPLVVRSSASATDRVAVELPPFSVVCANQTMCLFGLGSAPDANCTAFRCAMLCRLNAAYL